MTSEVDICNRALSAIGTRSTISSISPSDGSNEANQCALLYYPTRDALLRSAHWDFARRQVALSQLKASTDVPNTCPIPWAYEYAYPADCLKARYIIPQLPNTGTSTPPLTSAPNVNVVWGGYKGPPIRFFVGSDTNSSGNDITVILTNQPQAMMVYTRQMTNPDLFDAQFQEALVASLAAKLVPPLNLNLALMKGQIQLAEAIIAQARVTNGNEGPEVMDLLPSWMAVRGVGSYGYGYGYGWCGWDSMSWPSGL